MRTPLNAVLGFTRLLELTDLDEMQTEYLGHVTRGGQHLLELIDELLDLARAEAGGLPLVA